VGARCCCIIYHLPEPSYSIFGAQVLSSGAQFSTFRHELYKSAFTLRAFELVPVADIAISIASAWPMFRMI
jgi:hypothetical protein